jgi:hypothetical protein
MSVLSQFLKQEGERLRAEAPNREAKVRDWVRAVTDLLNKLQEWVRQADAEGIMKMGTGESKLSYTEEGLGEYNLPSLWIRLDTRTVWITGKARNVVDRIRPSGYSEPKRADGLVVITNSPLGDRLRSANYYLYRLAEADGDHWFIRHPFEEEVKPLDQERFEAVLVSLLK